MLNVKQFEWKLFILDSKIKKIPFLSGLSYCFIFFKEHPDPWRLQCEVSKAAEDMGGTAASLVVSALLDYLRRRVFLVPAWTDDGTAHIVSSVRNFPTFVSIKDTCLHFF